jgi:hypothetical protein
VRTSGPTLLVRLEAVGVHHPSLLLDALKDVRGRRGRLVDALPVLVTELVEFLYHLPSLLLGLPPPVITPRHLFFLCAPQLCHSLMLEQCDRCAHVARNCLAGGLYNSVSGLSLR